jgi:hypothetical protein
VDGVTAEDDRRQATARRAQVWRETHPTVPPADPEPIEDDPARLWALLLRVIGKR